MTRKPAMNSEHVRDARADRRSSPRRFAVLAAVFASLALEILALAGCGGTTGRQDMPSPGATAGEDAGGVLDAAAPSELDATVGDATPGPGFDATIVYADAGRLPHFDFDASMDAGGGGPSWDNWPDCPPDTVYQDPTFGAVGVPPDSGPCSPEGFVWTLRPECDRCYRYSGLEKGAVLGQPFPPCSDLRDAGNAIAGPAKGTSFFDLCAAVYTCELSTGCWTHAAQSANPSGPVCYCGDAGLDPCGMGNGNGVCKAEIEGAFQVIPNDPVQGPKAVITSWTRANPNSAQYAGAEAMSLLYVLQQPIPSPPSLSQCEWACEPATTDAAPPQPPNGALYTKTESLIHDANPSCYACLKDVGCLDDNRGDTNNECEDLAGQTVPAGAAAGAGLSRQDLCYTTLQCILGSQPCLNDFQSYFSSNRCFADVDAGGCLEPEQNGLETTDPTVMTNDFNDTTRGAGMANKIFNCAVNLNCPSCFPQSPED